MKNDSDCEIYFTARADGARLTVTVYGKSPDYEIRTRSEIKKITPCETEYVVNADLPSDEAVIARGNDGIESEGYIEFWKNGGLISSKKLRRDIYAPQKRVIAVRELP
jgi:hypothetical protein